MVIVLSLICYGLARLYRYYVKQQRRGLLEPPIDLYDDFKKKDDKDETDTEINMQNNRSRYTKAQARQRFKMGKS